MVAYRKNTCVKRGTMRIKYLVQEHNSSVPARARTRTNHLANGPNVPCKFYVVPSVKTHRKVCLFNKKKAAYVAKLPIRPELNPLVKGATSSFVYFEKRKNWLNFSKSSFSICFNLLHPQPSLFLFALESPLWYSSSSANHYF